MIYKSWQSGANAVKFQTFIPEELSSINNKVADYQKKNIKKKISSINILRICKLNYEDHFILKKYSESLGIDFISSAFEMKSLRFLSKDLKIKNHKIPSGEITNFQLLFEHGKLNHNVILSTGMSSLKEIEKALNILLAGYMHKRKKVSLSNNYIKKNFLKKNKNILKKKVTLLHCISNYPTEIKDINLNIIKTLKEKFDLPIGLSDHTISVLTPAVAVALGAKIIEKHITLNKKMFGPDHISSILPIEFSSMVKNIRNAEKMLGEKIKKPNSKEKKILKIVRKYLIASRKIEKGEIFSKKNISSKRGKGAVCASKYWELLGKKSNKNYNFDSFIEK